MSWLFFITKFCHNQVKMSVNSAL